MTEPSTGPRSKTELLERMRAGREEWDALIAQIPDSARTEPALAGGWSVKDLIAHVGSWFAEAATMLEQMRMGTYRREGLDVDGLNERWFQTWWDQDLPVIKTELMSARARMLEEWDRLPEVDDEARRWFSESTVEHYEEHLPQLRWWTAELQSRATP